MDQVTYNEFFKELNDESKKKLQKFDPAERVKWISYIHAAQKKAEQEAAVKAGEQRGFNRRILFWAIAMGAVIWVFLPGPTPEEIAAEAAEELAEKQAEMAEARGNLCLTWHKGTDWPSQRFFKQACGSDGLKQFSEWDGSHRETITWTESQLHNPSSFEHVETEVAGLDNPHQPEMVIHMTFRATNGFGAVITNKALVEVDKRTGKVLSGEII